MSDSEPVCRNCLTPLSTHLSVESLCAANDALNRVNMQSTNYTANRESRPTEIELANGRRIRIINDENGPYLEVEMV